MSTTEKRNINLANSKQQIFQEMFVGTLLYVLVLGFFDDYSSILQISSFSIVFLVAIVMQLLTYGTFATKNFVKRWFKKRNKRFSNAGLVFGVWLVLFLSKFVFLAVIDFLFDDSVEITGFVGLMAVIIALTLVHTLAKRFYETLAD